MERNRNEYLGRLIKKLQRIESKSVDQFKMNSIISNIRQFLNKESNHATNQELIGLRKVFRDMVVKFWMGNEFNNNDDVKHNKVIT